MNRTVLCKRIMGLSILIFVFSIFTILPVRAATKEECKNFLSNVKYISRYTFKISETDTPNQYKVSIDPTSSDADLQKALRKIVFKVVKINNTAQDGSKHVSYKNPIVLPGQFVKNSEGEDEMTVTLESVEENADPECTGKVTFEAGISKQGEPVILKEELNPIQDEFPQTNGLAIDCSKPQEVAFNKAFCEAKNGAIAADPNGKNGLNYSGKFDNKKVFSNVVEGHKELKCAVDKFASKDNYYVNRTYLYGSGENNMSFGNYVYHYTPGTVTTGAEVKCKVKCEEAVVVEYGPPVASKAGLCFEYKVKVTSRVSCSMSEKPVLPDNSGEYCTPTPLCTRSNGTGIITNQGGPSEDFDACIKTCDGGKYTDKCTKKCYKQVYGTSKTSKTSTQGRDYLTRRLTAKADDSQNFSINACIASQKEYHGCYTRSGGDIIWVGEDYSTPGRWYKISNHIDLTQYGVFGNGIYRHIWSDGSHCHDLCWWSGCSNENVYLNPHVAEKDLKINRDKYQDAVAACKATASCTTTTADFTISVNYKDGNNKKQTINFPYTKNNDGVDHLTSKGKTNGYKDTNNNKNTTILSYAGCYDKKDNGNVYMTEWSFPGSWVNRKTGEVSYVHTEDSAWRTLKDKFCIPLDAQDVNQKWWNYYYQTHSTSSTSSTSSSDYQKNCVEKGYGAKTITTITNNDVDEWNINAKTTNFGYFGWNIKISCFYALNKDPSLSTNTDSDKIPLECKSDSAYRIRSVDLNNLFPASDGSSNSRTPGFNWSEYATMTKKPENAANGYYTINPSEYAKQVQKVGDGVYSDRYLDYSIDLSRSMIAALKKENKAIENNYSDFAGKTEENYVINYRSPLFAEGGLLRSSSIVPKEDSLICNNMKNHNGGCEE